MIATNNGHVEVVDKLLQYGAAVDLRMEVIESSCIIVIDLIIMLLTEWREFTDDCI